MRVIRCIDNAFTLSHSYIIEIDRCDGIFVAPDGFDEGIFSSIFFVLLRQRKKFMKTRAS